MEFISLDHTNDDINMSEESEYKLLEYPELKLSVENFKIRQFLAREVFK